MNANTLPDPDDARATVRIHASNLALGVVVVGFTFPGWSPAAAAPDRVVLSAYTDDARGTIVRFKDGTRDLYPIGSLVTVVVR